MLRVQQIRVDVVQLRARSALAAAATAADPKSLLRIAQRDARRLEREGAPWAEALARLIRAGIATFDRDESATARLLGEAITMLTAVDMYIFAESARRYLGKLLGGDEGRKLVAQADAWMGGQNVVNPARMAATFFPLFPD
jgi:eukaryotic-like serine/threonine-protein kinase